MPFERPKGQTRRFTILILKHYAHRRRINPSCLPCKSPVPQSINSSLNTERCYGNRPICLIHSYTTSPMVLERRSLIHAINGRANLKSGPYSEFKNCLTFWMFLYILSTGVARPIGVLCQSKSVVDLPCSLDFGTKYNHNQPIFCRI